MQKYTVLDTNTNQILDDEITHVDFRERFLQSDKFTDWIEEKHYDRLYGEKLLARYLRQHDSYSQAKGGGFTWLNYEFIPNGGERNNN